MRRTAWCLGSLILLPIACSTGGELFSDGPGTTRAAATSGPGTGGSTTEAATSAETSAATGGSPASASVSSTASESASTGSGVMAEIPCTVETCAMGLICCVHPFNDTQDHCAAPGACERGYVEVGCNGPNDCEQNEVCCGTYSPVEGYEIVACTNSCNNTQTTQGITMCGDDASACSSTQSCVPSGFLPVGHNYCYP